ncbi:klaC, partial [Escherichia coli]
MIYAGVLKSFVGAISVGFLISLIIVIFKVFDGEGVTTVLPLLGILPVIFGAKMMLSTLTETPEDDSFSP